MELYRIKELNFSFPEGSKQILADINMNIQEGEFIVLCGQSGCGKSTFLRQLKPVLTPHGKRTGEILYRGDVIMDIDHRTVTSEIGFVQQNVENGIVTDKVWHELAFGLESLGYDQSTIRLRVAEMASFFGIQHWFHKEVSELSGGQKQLLNLASIMAMHPSVLILDEPTSQLDPIAATEFLTTLKKINQELGTAIVISEHRLEEVMPLADRIIVMDQGQIIVDDTPRQGGHRLAAMNHPMFASMPTPMQIQTVVESQAELSMTVKEGRQWLDRYVATRTGVDGKRVSFVKSNESNALINTDESTTQLSKSMNSSMRQMNKNENKYETNKGIKRKRLFSKARADQQLPVIQFQEVWFKYDKHGSDVIKDLSFSVKQGEFFCIVGGNGAGKTSTLSLISGIHMPYRGKIMLSGKDIRKWSERDKFNNYLGVLPQNPQTLFVKKTVKDDLYEMLQQSSLTKEQQEQKVNEIIQFAQLEHLLSMHPFDLSGGEQQRAALAKVLLLEPKILLLDEPTKGLDRFFKTKLAQFLKKLNDQGVTIVLVSHDIEFCAEYGETCAMFFDGSMITTNKAKPFFAGNSFYTTTANRMTRHVWDDAVTIEDVIIRCQSLV
ncbi:MAG: energy-coupling factor transporter ATPase [Candidatus Pristimantibacillus lignocellulolyticus]|uniref:Energy-coupling factor transporter ATPase n=1 Tax=Candidatus Pristimantibacillus lignocellulolyticus TaxID=2994561 RepID=A0A9J6ZJH8_9BACL|nr:MAG: energy-coupling factor transporter ATPase [Candidatus Pristimantibacillus lignocellulolyticus]